MTSVAEKKLFKNGKSAHVNVQRVLVLPEDPTSYELLSTQVCKDGSMIYNIKEITKEAPMES